MPGIFCIWGTIACCGYGNAAKAFLFFRFPIVFSRKKSYNKESIYGRDTMANEKQNQEWDSLGRSIEEIIYKAIDNVQITQEKAQPLDLKFRSYAFY